MLVLAGRSSPHRLLVGATAPGSCKKRLISAPERAVLSQSANERAQDLNRIGADCFGNRDKLNDVDAALATFVFGYKGLRSFQALGELLLCQIGLCARADHELAEDLLLPGVDRFDNAALSSRHGRGRLIPLSDYPITGYCPESELSLSPTSTRAPLRQLRRRLFWGMVCTNHVSCSSSQEN